MTNKTQWSQKKAARVFLHVYFETDAWQQKLVTLKSFPRTIATKITFSALTTFLFQPFISHLSRLAALPTQELLLPNNVHAKDLLLKRRCMIEFSQYRSQICPGFRAEFQHGGAHPEKIIVESEKILIQ